MVSKITEAHVTHIISLERQGRVTPDTILDDAKRPESPLHNLYDWNVEKAAQAHWLERTREIIRLIRVVVTTETITVRPPRYIKDPGIPANEQGYVALHTLRVDPTLARRALITELERVTSSLIRAQRIAAGLELDDQIAGILAQVSGLRTIVRSDQESTSTLSSEEISATA